MRGQDKKAGAPPIKNIPVPGPLSPGMPTRSCALRYHHRRRQRIRSRRLGQTVRRRNPQRRLRHLHRWHRHRTAGDFRGPDHRPAAGRRHRSDDRRSV